MADHPLYHQPVSWLYRGPKKLVARQLFEALKQRIGATMNDLLVNSLFSHAQVYSVSDNEWFFELHSVRALAARNEGSDYQSPDYIFILLAQILCQALEVPRDCERQLLYGEHHDLRFFTNHRAIQVHCCHCISERLAFGNLVDKDWLFQTKRHVDKVDGVNYEKYTEKEFYKARKSLAWECIFPEGIDMEALSPRDANAHIGPKQQATKAKAPPQKLNQKEKDHPPPPPGEVKEPPSSDRRNGAIYQTGKCLGKGGFAICYEGQLAGAKQKYALKIVKSYMPQKKMEQKVMPIIS
jgi:hypothetical protein